MQKATFGAAALALLLALPAAAQSPMVKDLPVAEPDPDPEIIKVYDDDTLKPAEIRQCLRDDMAIADMEAKVADYEQTLKTFRGQIHNLGDNLDRRRKQIDGTDPDAVAEYNRRVERHASMIERYYDKFLPNLEGRQQKLNAAIDAYNADCATKSYFEEDWVEAVKELGIEDPRKVADGGK